MQASGFAEGSENSDASINDFPAAQPLLQQITWDWWRLGYRHKSTVFYRDKVLRVVEHIGPTSWKIVP